MPCLPAETIDEVLWYGVGQRFDGNQRLRLQSAIDHGIGHGSRAGVDPVAGRGHPAATFAEQLGQPALLIDLLLLQSQLVLPRLVDDVPHQIALAALDEIGVGTGLLRTPRRQRPVVAGQHDHLGEGERPLDLTGRLQTAHAGHPEVHQDDVGLEARRQLDPGLAVRALADHVDPFVGEDLPDAPAIALIIFDEEHTGLRGIAVPSIDLLVHTRSPLSIVPAGCSLGYPPGWGTKRTQPPIRALAPVCSGGARRAIRRWT